MKHLCCSRVLLFLVLSYTALFASLQDKSAIVYYGDDISYPMVGIHDYIIVEPKHIDTHTHGFKLYKEKIYAYVSIGEVSKKRSYFTMLKKEWIAGTNKTWQSAIMDVGNPDYQNFLFDKVIDPLIRKGFKNFFFDTLDSYQLIYKDKKSIIKAQKALTSIIKHFHNNYPHAKLILNRGFDIIDAVHNDINAVLFESYYFGLSGKTLDYKAVTDEDRKWLDNNLQKIKSYHLDIIALDYLSKENFHKSTKLVKRLKQNGFIPYIANKELDIYGRSSKNAVKREVLFLVDTSQHDKRYSDAHTIGSLPLEYQGYIPRLYSLTGKELPRPQKIASRYAGVVVWIGKDYEKSTELLAWVKELHKQGVYTLFANSFWIDTGNGNFKSLGLDIESTEDLKRGDIVYQDQIMDFELSPIKTFTSYIQGRSIKKELYTLADNSGKKTILAAITDWGGYVVADTMIIDLKHDMIWSINPFEMYKKILRLKSLPVPDPTTHNGKRILFSHIDGDAFMSRVEWNPKLFCTESLYKEVFTQYKIPQSISIIGGEIGPNGLYPKLSKRLESIARKIYKLPYVEGASHTYSHPFEWEKIDHDGNLDPKFRLPIKAYTFSLTKEISGNINYINSVLMPKNKPKKLLAKTVFWSGSCDPTYRDLKLVYQNKYLNINGGDTTITNKKPWLSKIAPFGINRKNYQQIYTGQQDENVYTDNWRKNFWGFKNVVQTYKLTNSPRRFKPIDIYYHFYSGSKRASINAIKYVFDWAIQEDIIPMYTSEYIPKVMDFYNISMSNEKQKWYISGMKNLQTLRINDKNLYINFLNSEGAVGENDFEIQRYIHLYGEAVYLELCENKPIDNVYLVDSNGVIKEYKQTAEKTHYRFTSHVSLKVRLHVPQGCKITKGKNFLKKEDVDIASFIFNTKEASIDVTCKK